MTQTTTQATQTQTTQTTQTVVDSYMSIFDRAAQDPAAVEEFRSIFALDATVEIVEGGEPVRGLDAIIAVYRAIAAETAYSRHFWTVTVLDDDTLEGRFAAALREADGSLVSMSGIQHATLNSDGLITNLRARAVSLDTRDTRR